MKYNATLLMLLLIPGALTGQSPNPKYSGKAILEAEEAPMPPTAVMTYLYRVQWKLGEFRKGLGLHVDDKSQPTVIRVNKGSVGKWIDFEMAFNEMVYSYFKLAQVLEVSSGVTSTEVEKSRRKAIEEARELEEWAVEAAKRAKKLREQIEKKP